MYEAVKVKIVVVASDKIKATQQDEYLLPTSDVLQIGLEPSEAYNPTPFCEGYGRERVYV